MSSSGIHNNKKVFNLKEKSSKTESIPYSKQRRFSIQARSEFYCIFPMIRIAN